MYHLVKEADGVKLNGLTRNLGLYREEVYRGRTTPEVQWRICDRDLYTGKGETGIVEHTATGRSNRVVRFTYESGTVAEWIGTKQDAETWAARGIENGKVEIVEQIKWRSVS